MNWSGQEESHVVEFRKTNRIWSNDVKWKKQLQEQSCSSTNTSGTYLPLEKSYKHEAKCIDHLLYVRCYKNDQDSLKELIIHCLRAGSSGGRWTNKLARA